MDGAGLASGEETLSHDGARHAACDLRILHVFDHSVPLHSGYTFRSLSILTQQRARGWETAHLTTRRHRREGPETEEVDGLVFHRTRPGSALLERIPIARELSEMAATQRRLAALARELRPHVIHAHSPVLNAIPALRVGRRLGIPVVYEIRAFWEDAAVSHGTTGEGAPRYRLGHWLETRAAFSANRVTTICQGLRDDLIGRGLPAEKITVIPNAVDVASFGAPRPADAELRARLGLDGKTVIGFIGSFYHYEGLHVLLDAMPLLLAARPDTRLLLVGGGPEDARLRARARARGVDHATVFTGRVPHGEVGRYYDLIDLLVYPRISIRLTELVTPLKPLEAMAERRMVAASDVGGHRELIRDGETGTLFRAGDPVDLAAVVARVLSSRDGWAAQLERARRFVETERNWPDSVARYRAVYDAIVAGADNGGVRI